MPKRTKKAGIPLADLAKDYPDALVSDDSGKPRPIAEVLRDDTWFQTCRICGTACAGDVCPVDGYRFTMENA